MTHDHAEDAALCDAALRTPALGSIGLIGSDAKWARFERKLRDEGHSADDVARITTPIGLDGIDGKEPAVIAVSVAAALLSGVRQFGTARLTRVRNRWLLWAWLALCAVMALAAYVVVRNQPPVDTPEDAWPYVAVFALVFGDAVIAVLPGETTLNTASTLAAQGVLELKWVMVAGAFGAVARRLRAVLDRPRSSGRGSSRGSTPR